MRYKQCINGIVVFIEGDEKGFMIVNSEDGLQFLLYTQDSKIKSFRIPYTKRYKITKEDIELSEEDKGKKYIYLKETK